MKLNTYLMGVSEYPSVVVDLVSDAMLVIADTRASEETATTLSLHAHTAGVWFHGKFMQHRSCGCVGVRPSALARAVAARVGGAGRAPREHNQNPAPSVPG